MSPILGSWVIVLFHAPLAVTAWLITRHWLERPAGWRAACDAFLIGCILWRAESLLLHLSGNIDRVSVLVAHVLLLGVTVLWLRKRTVGVAAAREEPSSAMRGATAVLSGIVVLAVAAALHRIAALPDPYDSLTYHLMFPAHWLSSSSLDLFSTSFGDIALTYTPAAVEGFFFGLMLPTGSDMLARVGQLPFFLVSIAVLFELTARDRSGRARLLAVLAPLVFLCWPRLLIQASGSMVDVAAAAFFLAALLAVQRWQRHRRTRELIFAGALVGLFLGSRFTGVVFAPLLFVAVAPSLGRDARRWMWFLLPLAAMGAYPYLRNAWLAGNPLYPIHLALGEWNLLPGLFTREATHAMPFHMEFRELLTLAWHELGITGPLWLVLGLAAPFTTKDATTRWCAGLAVGLIVLHCFVVPYNSNLRFLFPAWGMLLVAATRALAASQPGALTAALLSVFTLVYFIGWRLPLGLSRFSDVDTVTAALAAGALLVMAMLVGFGVMQLATRARWVSVGLFSALALTLAGTLHEQRLADLHAIESRDPRYVGHASSWQRMREVPQGRVAYCGANLPYPLVGGAVQHVVGTAPLDGSEPNLLPHEGQRQSGAEPNRRTVHVYPDRVVEDRARWKQRMLESFDYLAIYIGPPGTGRNPVEYDWARAEPEHFRRIDGSKPVRGRYGLQIYQVIRGD